MQTIQQLSAVVVDMQEKISDMQHLLTSQADNQEVPMPSIHHAKLICNSFVCCIY